MVDSLVIQWVDKDSMVVQSMLQLFAVVVV